MTAGGRVFVDANNNGTEAAELRISSTASLNPKSYQSTTDDILYPTIVAVDIENQSFDAVAGTTNVLMPVCFRRKRMAITQRARHI